MLTNACRRAASARARDMFDRCYNGENDCDRERNRKRCKDATGDHIARSDLSPPFLLHAMPEIWSVQNIHAPFDHFNDGNSNRDRESKKQNELDDHFSDP
jgi:hypothetical protein